MRCDTKRAICWDLYNKHISIFCVKHMSTIFRTLQVNKWRPKNQTFFSFCEINATKFGSKNLIHLDCIMQFQYWCYITTNVCSRKKCYYFWWSSWLISVMITDTAWFCALSTIDGLIWKRYNFSVFTLELYLVCIRPSSKSVFNLVGGCYHTEGCYHNTGAIPI